jgi:cytosine/adenosine deaminase-related metal-dependent hydrolase
MLLIHDVTAVTLDARRRIVTEAAIAVEADRIAAVGKAADLAARYPAAERLDGRGMLALPGFIDAHVHSDQAILRGVADDLPWRPFLYDYIFPLLAHRGAADALASLRLCLLEMLKAGTTTFVDCMVHNRYDFDRLAQAVLDFGLRGVLARYVMPAAAFDQALGPGISGPIRTEAEALAAAEASVRRWNGAGGGRGRLQVWYGPIVPRDPATCDPAFYRRVSRAAADLGTGITIHLAAERDDLDFFQSAFGQRPAAFARDSGLLGPNVLLIGGCWFTAPEIELLAATGTALCHSPSANMKMASGVAPVPQMRAAGVTVALGCDAGANNNCHDMIREMKAASLLHNLTRADAAALPAEAVLEMATIGGARAIGREADLGSLEPGKQADIVLVDLQQPHTTPGYDPIANLVYAAHGGNVDTVLVAGRVLLRGRQVLCADEAEILREAEAAGRALLERAGLRVGPGWPVE